MFDKEEKQVTLIDVRKKRFESDSMCYYVDEEGQVYCGGSNHPTLGHSAGRTVEDIGKMFFMRQKILARAHQGFDNGEFHY